MNPLPLHPKIVHLPLALAALMPLISVGFLLAWWRGWFSRKTWIAVIVLQVTLVGTGFFAMQSGEDDEEVVEKIVAKKHIHQHEEAAEAFVYTAVGVLLIALVAGFFPSETVGLVAGLATIIATIVVLGLAIKAGEAGGELVYRHGAAAAHAGTAGVSGATPAAADKDKDKDKD